MEYDISAVEIVGDTWKLSGEGTTEQVGIFSRTINFYDVCRNVLNNIAECPSEYIDPHTKEVAVDVEWDVINGGQTTAIRYTAYLTNWNSRDWIQTDWSGGDGQDTRANAY